MDDIFNGTMAEVISRLEARFRPEVIQALVKAAHHMGRISTREFEDALLEGIYACEYTDDCIGGYRCACDAFVVGLYYTLEDYSILADFVELADKYFIRLWEANKSNKLVQKCGLGIEVGFNFLNPNQVEVEDNLDIYLELPVETAGQRSTRCANRARRRARALGLGRVRNLAS